MSTIHFFRHGQAGLRDDYDRLSELGHEQAAQLAEYVASERYSFDQVIVGGLRRQRETAEPVLAALDAAGMKPQLVVEDPGWSEFDLDIVFDGIAPRLAEEDEQFRREYEEIRRLVSSGDGHIHRRWTPADAKVVKAWIEGRYTTHGESWLEFVERVRRAAAVFETLPHNAQVAVFTSATPVSICVAAAFGSQHPGHIMKLAGAAVNTNITIVHNHQGDWHLAQFNAVPHLAEARLRTFR